MDDSLQEGSFKKLPFNNLYLISGLINGFNKSWMYVATIFLLMTGYIMFQSVTIFPLMNVLIQNGYSETEILKNANLLFDSNALKMDRNAVLALELGMFVFASIGFIIGIKYIHKKTLTSVLTGYDKFRYKRFFFAFVVWGMFIIGSVILDFYLNPDELFLTFNLQGFLISAFIMILLMPVQTGIEEVLFRGYLIQGLSQIFKNGYIPLILTSLLFGLAHMSNPEVKEYGWPIMLTYYCGFALFMGAITLLDEGLELAWGIHFANNMISGLMVTSSHSVIKTYSIFETKTENPYAEILVWIFMATAAFLIFKYKYNWKNFGLILN